MTHRRKRSRRTSPLSEDDRIKEARQHVYTNNLQAKPPATPQDGLLRTRKATPDFYTEVIYIPIEQKASFKAAFNRNKCVLDKKLRCSNYWINITFCSTRVQSTGSFPGYETSCSCFSTTTRITFYSSWKLCGKCLTSMKLIYIYLFLSDLEIYNS